MGNNSANCHLWIVTSPYQNFLELFVCSWSGMARGNLSCGTWGHTAPEPQRPHNHLKVLRMTGVYSYKSLFDLVLYIARNATALQRMVIDPMAKKKLCSHTWWGSTICDRLGPEDGETTPPGKGVWWHPYYLVMRQYSTKNNK